MEPRLVSADTYWFFFTPFVSSALQDSTLLSQFIICSSILISGFFLIALVKWASPSGCAWSSDRRCSIPGPRGWPIIGSLFQMHGLAHRKLARMAKDYNAKSLMAFSLGCSRVVIASKPETARQLLNSPNFANRPVKESAHMLLFSRAIGFAPYGDYWRNLRRIAASYMFSPRRISAQEALRQSQTSQLIIQVATAARNNTGGMVQIRPFLQRCSLNNIMGSVFGRTYEFGSGCSEANQLEEMVREGFDLLGASNWADHLPALKSFDPQGIIFRCQKLVPKVTAFVKSIIDEHRAKFPNGRKDDSGADFVDVLLTLSSNEQLQDEDMVAVLWEMIFRGTDTTAILTEWVLAELVLHPEIQSRVQSELDHVVGAMRPVQDVDIAKLPYLQAVVKETLRMHPPGPLLSWARLSTHDCMLDGHFIPAGTTAMVNMWMITHDESIWANPEVFRPERFMEEEVDIKGGDLRLAPFGAGRRVCPGRALGLATVHLWLARLFQHFCWLPGQDVAPIDLKECLKLSCEMATPLLVRPVPRPNMPPIHPRDVNKAHCDKPLLHNGEKQTIST